MSLSRSSVAGALVVAGVLGATVSARHQAGWSWVSLAGVHARATASRLFQTSDACIACHNNMQSATGEDISFGAAWRGSTMANSARDPYWLATVRREVSLAPQRGAQIEDECAACHMPMSRYEARVQGQLGRVFAHLPIGGAGEEMSRLAADGVSCTVCHQITPQGLGTDASYGGGFRVDETAPIGARPVYGRYNVDAGRMRLMHSASEFVPKRGEHLGQSEMCATCHTLFTTAIDEQGNVVGRLAEQVPYLEWKASSFAATQSCQSCHMPEVPGEAPVSGVLGVKRPHVARHDFLGGNALMLAMLSRYRDTLGVRATTADLSTAHAKTLALLATQTGTLSISAVRVDDGQLRAQVAVGNLTGHKFPTAYPSRRAWLHAVVRDAGGSVLFESGALEPSGAIAGNDNDRDAVASEPHYTTISSGTQVQVYEAVLADTRGRVTTSVLAGVRYLKDNRLLPAGFVRAAASSATAPQGVPADDADFAGGGDHVQYLVDVSRAQGSVTIEVELLYQPIGYRWAQNLGTGTPSSEGVAFVRMFNSLASQSAARVAIARATADR